MKDIYRLSVQKKAKLANPGDIARLAAPKAAQVLYNILSMGPRVILRSAFELLRANMVTRILSAVILISFDTFSLLRGRISWKQYVINLVLALLLLVGGTAGWVIGNDVIGAVLLENMVLGIIAGVVGAGLVGGLLGAAWEYGVKLFLSDDSEDMLEICTCVFAELCEKCSLNTSETTEAKLLLHLDARLMSEMFSQKDRDAFARRLIEPCVEEVIRRRS